MATRRRGDSQNQEVQKIDKSSLLLFAGFAMLGVALMLVIFGNGIFGDTPDPALEQVPALDDSSAAPVATGGGRPLQVGDAAYDFVTRDLDGNPVRLSAYRGQPVVVNFWATWCPPCRREMPDLQQAYQEHRQDGLVILAINQDEPVELVRSFFYEENGFSFTPVLDEDSLISGGYGIRSFPTTIFVNSEGVVTAVHQGLLLPDQLDAYLAQTIPSQG